MSRSLVAVSLALLVATDAFVAPVATQRGGMLAAKKTAGSKAAKPEVTATEEVWLRIGKEERLLVPKAPKGAPHEQ